MNKLVMRLLVILRALRSLLGRRAPPGDTVRRLLVAHYLLLGDTILLAPLLKALALRYPGAERVVLARPTVAALFEGRPYGVTVLPFDRQDASSRRRVIESGPYDLAIVPDDNRYAWLARAAGARRVIGFAHDRPAWKNWMLDRAVPYPVEPGAWADLAARHLRDDDAITDPPAFGSGEWPVPSFEPFRRPAQAYVVLHVGASTPLKTWPASRWRALADDFAARGLHVVWSGGANERGLFDAIGAHDGETDLVGALTLPQLWHLLADAKVLVCPDTGVAHLARVVGVPTIALFGPGSRVVHGPGRFWGGMDFRPVTLEDFPCRDQRTLYRRDVTWVRRCGRRYDAAAQPSGRSDPSACGRALCMDGIDVALVVDACAAVRVDPTIVVMR